MPLGVGLGDTAEADAADRGVHVREAAGEGRVAGVEVVRFEELAADVGLDGAQPHTSHGLAELLERGLAELVEGLVGVGVVAGRAGRGGVLLLGAQSGREAVHRGGPEAERGGDVVGAGELAGVRDDGDPHTQAVGDEPLVHRGDGEQQRDRSMGGVDGTVGEHGDAALLCGETCHAVTEPVDRVGDGVCVGVGIGGIRLVEQVEATERDEVLLAQPQHVQVGQDGRFHHDLVGGLAGVLGVRGVRLGAEGDAEGHAVRLTDGVQRRIGDLGETL